MRGPAALLAALALGLGGCGDGPAAPGPAPRSPAAESCEDIATEYLILLPEAQVCEVGTDACAATRPLPIVSQGVSGSSNTELSTCLVIVNPARVAGLDALLQRYALAGCTLAAYPCPHPPELPGRCQAVRDGTGTC